MRIVYKGCHCGRGLCCMIHVRTCLRFSAIGCFIVSGHGHSLSVPTPGGGSRNSIRSFATLCDSTMAVMKPRSFSVSRGGRCSVVVEGAAGDVWANAEGFFGVSRWAFAMLFLAVFQTCANRVVVPVRTGSR